MMKIKLKSMIKYFIYSGSLVVGVYLLGKYVLYFDEFTTMLTTMLLAAVIAVVTGLEERFRPTIKKMGEKERG